MIGLVIPTRDRPEFLKHSLWLLKQQTLQPDLIEIVDDKPIKFPDVTWRYKLGCKRLVEKGAKVIIFWEDDDWYCKDYIKIMFSEWQREKPDMLGISKTLYYHIGIQKYRILRHPGRSSAMSMLISRNIIEDWEDLKFLDLYLWNNYNGLLIEPENWICVGIKHGIGSYCGSGHTKDFCFTQTDDWSYIKSIIDKHSLNFYKKILKKGNI